MTYTLFLQAIALSGFLAAAGGAIFTALDLWMTRKDHNDRG